MDIIESILVLSKAGFSAGDIKAMLSLRSQTPAQPVQQMQTPAIDNQLLSGLMHSITGLQNAIQSQAIFNSLQPQIPNGAQKADDALASIVLPGNTK